MGMGGNGNIRFSKNIPAFLGIALAVAYDSAGFAAMHFRPTITKKKLKTNYQVANIQRSTEAFAACFQYSRCLLFVCLLNCVCNCICKFIRMEQYATGGNGNS